MAEIRVEKRYLRNGGTWTHWHEIPTHSAVAMLGSRYLDPERHLCKWNYALNRFAEYRIIPEDREEGEREPDPC